VVKLSDKLKEIRREVAELNKKLEELKRLKTDCDDAKKFRGKIVKVECD